jgi:hypothetical protein
MPQDHITGFPTHSFLLEGRELWVFKDWRASPKQGGKAYKKMGHFTLKHSKNVIDSNTREIRTEGEESLSRGS